MPTCLITGCDLVDFTQDRWCHGDLHAEGDCYVFNACLEKGETAWQFEELEERKEGRTLLLLAYPFERRGVIVISKQEAILHGGLLQYVGGDQG